jgi:hypothetical protein
MPIHFGTGFVERANGLCYTDRMVLVRVLTLFLVAVVTALVPLAQASPPDQTWLGGFYDNADYDDVVLSITSTTATAETTPPSDLGPTRTVVGSLPISRQPVPPITAPAPQQPRAPPSA